MAAIPQRLEESVNDNQDPRSRLVLFGKTALEPGLGLGGESEDIPIFCAGGCGEVMGYVKKGQSVPTSRCPVCAAAEAAKVPSARAATVLANTDELAELRSPPRDLCKFRILQVVAVVLIFAGSACIAMGRPVGVYLAASGTVAWIAVSLVLWRLRS